MAKRQIVAFLCPKLPSLSLCPKSQTTTSGGKMFCVICKTASQTDKMIAQNNVFVQGCFSLCVKSVKIHESSANHVRATTFVAARAEPEKTPVYKMICSLDDSNWNWASGPSGLLTRLTTQKKMNMDPWTLTVTYITIRI